MPDISALRSLLPATFTNGWHAKSVYNGLPVWYYNKTTTFAPRGIVAIRAVNNATSLQLLEELKDLRVFSAIFPDLPKFTREEKKGRTDTDTLVLPSNSYQSNILTVPSALQWGEEEEDVLTLERYWSSCENESWLYVYPAVQLLSNKLGYWVCFLVQDMGENSSLLHILTTCPSKVSFETTCERISTCHAFIHDHIETLRRYQALNSSSQHFVQMPTASKEVRQPRQPRPRQLKESAEQTFSSRTTRHISMSVEVVGHMQLESGVDPLQQLDEFKESGVDPLDEFKEIATKINQGNESLGSSMEEEEETTKCNDLVSKDKPLGEQYPKLAPYIDSIEESIRIITGIWEADEKTEGWNLYNQKHDVTVLCKPSPQGDDFFKGTTTIHVPLHFLMAYTKDLNYRPEYDSIFESGSVVEELGDSASAILHLVYKDMFMVTGRDFCSLSSWRHIRDNVYGLMLKAVQHPACPEQPHIKVRGEIVLGGYVFEEVSVNPPVINMMYTVCMDMRGNLPVKIVNKVLCEQLFGLATVRDKVEERYRKCDTSLDGHEDLKNIRLLPSIQKDLVLGEDVSDDEDEWEDVHAFMNPSHAKL